MKNILKAACVAAVAMTPIAANAACDDGEIVVKFSHVTNTDVHPKGIAASLLEQRVNDEMNGKMCLEVFPNSTLYNDNKVLEAMLQGDVQLAAPSLSKFEKFTKQFRIFDLPFMFKDINAVEAFQASDAGQAMLDSMQNRGLQRKWKPSVVRPKKWPSPKFTARCSRALLMGKRTLGRTSTAKNSSKFKLV